MKGTTQIWFCRSGIPHPRKRSKTNTYVPWYIRYVGRYRYGGRLGQILGSSIGTRAAGGRGDMFQDRLGGSKLQAYPGSFCDVCQPLWHLSTQLKAETSRPVAPPPSLSRPHSYRFGLCTSFATAKRSMATCSSAAESLATLGAIYKGRVGVEWSGRLGGRRETGADEGHGWIQ